LVRGLSCVWDGWQVDGFWFMWFVVVDVG
jgi:hypothetical protein